MLVSNTTRWDYSQHQTAGISSLARRANFLIYLICINFSFVRIHVRFLLFLTHSESTKICSKIKIFLYVLMCRFILFKKKSFVCMCVCVYVCMYVCIYVCRPSGLGRDAFNSYYGMRCNQFATNLKSVTIQHREECC